MIHRVLADNGIVTGLDDGRQRTQSLFAFVQRGFDLLALGNIDSGRMQEHDRSRLIANGVHGKIHGPLAAVGQPVSKLFAENEARRGLIFCEANPGFHLLRTPPPGRFPEWLVKDLFSRVPAPLHG